LTGTRELVVTATGHIVVYALRRDEVAVLRIRHGKQRWPD
jgi:plasmid stabilization system protein ParE